jgi:hypothetical protein
MSLSTYWLVAPLIVAALGCIGTALFIWLIGPGE